MNILDKILAHKHKEVVERKAMTPVLELEKREFFSRDCISLKKSLLQNGASGIIAEIKRKSPSQGTIHPNVTIEDISTGYVKAGVSGISVLTDKEFFGGDDDDLIKARMLNSIPILRKDFIVDEYQIIEAKSLGADVVLLIAASLTPDAIQGFTRTARGFGLEVLLEVHDEQELALSLESGADLIGVNNRNLKTFEVSVETSRQLVEKIPDTYLKISESGIDAVETVLELRSLGYDGFLMGQNFMKHERPEVACEEFLNRLRVTYDQ